MEAKEFLLEKLNTIVTNIPSISIAYKYCEENQLNNYFYTNAPALLFPYVRAYISTLTTLSGVKPIILPTLNLSNLSNDLKENTEEVNEEC